MDIDIVFPNNNELEFVHAAEKLGYEAIYFVYSKPMSKTIFDAKLKVLPGSGLKLKKNENLIMTRYSENIRLVIEKHQTDMVFDFELCFRKDKLHFRNSGLNHVLCSLMSQNNISIAISLNNLLNSAGVERARLIGRIMQNLRLAKKYGVKIFFASFARTPTEMRSAHDLRSLFRIMK